MAKSVKEIIDAINSAKLNNVHDVDDIDGMDEAKQVDQINRDEHRWYTNATVVYSLGSEFIGVHGPVSMKSENGDWTDLCVEVTAFEMVQVPSVTYKVKS